MLNNLPLGYKYLDLFRPSQFDVVKDKQATIFCHESTASDTCMNMKSFDYWFHIVNRLESVSLLSRVIKSVTVYNYPHYPMEAEFCDSHKTSRPHKTYLPYGGSMLTKDSNTVPALSYHWINVVCSLYI